jgi:hypothetical protein
VGADAVYAAEISQHMCDVGEEATIMNGFLGRINMLDRWVWGGHDAVLTMQCRHLAKGAPLA